MKHCMIAVIFAFVSLAPALADSTDATKWSNEAAPRKAERVVSMRKPFLYSSGGFICRPEYATKYRSLAQGLPVQSLGCGCVLAELFIAQSAFAQAFNNRVLLLLSEQEKLITEVQRYVDSMLVVSL